jgi:hypothetical protein
MTYWSHHLKPLPLKDVQMYAKLITRARDGCRFVATPTGMEELSEEDYEAMLVETWKDMGRESVHTMFDAMLAGARKK